MMSDINYRLEKLGFIVKRVKIGKINRCATVSKPNKRNGWFIVGDDAVNYGSWDESIESGYFWIDEKIFKAKPTVEQLKLREKRLQELKELEQQEIKTRIQEVQKVFNVYHDFKVQSLYLDKKQALRRDDFKQDFSQKLIIPMYNINGLVVGYQSIDNNGAKMFKTGSVCKSAFYPIKYTLMKEVNLFILCEGYATGSSIYQALYEHLTYVNIAVIVCFSAKNIDNVAAEIKLKHKNSYVYAIKDMDNAGLSVKTIGFTVGVENGQDANDIHIKYGLEKLGSLIVKRLAET